MAAPKSMLSKYRMLISSVVFFLLFTSGVLGYNYYLTKRIAYQQVLVNTANRQSTLVQIMAKEVMDLQLYVQDYKASLTHQQQDSLSKNTTAKVLSQDEITNSIDILLNKLGRSSEEFNRNLDVLTQGGVLDSDNNTQLKVKALQDQESISYLDSIHDVWSPYKRLMDSFLTAMGQENTGKTIGYAVDYARVFNDSLYQQSRYLANHLAGTVQSDARHLQNIQIGSIIAALLIFMMVIFGALRRLIRGDRELEDARRETAQIMSTVNEGLFLVNKDLRIGSSYSKRLEDIIGQHNIGGKTLTTVLAGMISDENMKVVETFVRQLYNHRVVEDLVKELNPLKRFQVKITNPDGSTTSRYLDFNFSRVYVGEKIDRVLVSAVDITQSILLEQRLERERAQGDQQIEMLNAILNSDYSIIQSFMRSTEQRLTSINNVLRNPGTDQATMRAKANQIYREVHSLKGESSAIGLTPYVSACEAFEIRISQLQKMPSLTGEDFLSLTIILDELINLNELINRLVERLGTISQAQNPQGSIANTGNTEGAIVRYYEKFARDIAARHDKRVATTVVGMEDSRLTEEQREIIKDITVQFLRNAIVHGIEAPKKRLANGKGEQGNVQIILARKDDHTATLVVEDDGSGIDYQAIRLKAVEKGRLTANEAAAMDNRAILGLLFESGFSTAEQQDEDAGRGVGMDIIKDRIRSLGGRLSISSQLNGGTRFSIEFPIQ